MSIHEIRILMEEGKNDQALIKIEMSEENELDLKLLKSMVFRTQELFAIALSEAEGALKASREANSKIHELSAHTQVAYLIALSDSELAEDHILQFEILGRRYFLYYQPAPAFRQQIPCFSRIGP